MRAGPRQRLRVGSASARRGEALHRVRPPGTSRWPRAAAGEHVGCFFLCARARRHDARAELRDEGRRRGRKPRPRAQSSPHARPGRTVPSAEGPAIVDLTYEELRQYDVGRINHESDYAAQFPEQQPVDGERIPRLADVFALVEQSGNCAVRFNIETKIDPMRPEQTVSPLAFGRALIAVIREAGMASRTTIQSFDWRTLRLLRELAPEIALVALILPAAGRGYDRGWQARRLAVARRARRGRPRRFGAEARPGERREGLVAERTRPEPERRRRGTRTRPRRHPVDDERCEGHGACPRIREFDGLITDRPDLLRSVLQAKGIAVPPPTPVR